MTLESGEVIEHAVDDNKDTVYKEKSSIFPSVKSGANSDIPSAKLQVLKSNLKQEDEDKKVNEKKRYCSIFSRKMMSTLILSF